MFRTGGIKAALAVLASAGLVCFAMEAFAANSTAVDPYSVNYYENAQTVGPDDTLRTVDPDEYDAPYFACANIYVFDAIEEMTECCACPMSPAGRLDFSLNNNLTNNTLTGVTNHSGTIKIVKTNINLAVFASPPTTGALICDPTNGSNGNNNFVFSGPNEVFLPCGTGNAICPAGQESLLSWLTHDLNKFATNGTAVAEAEFQSTGEGIVPNPNTTGFLNGDLTVLQNECGFIQKTGRDHGGRGVCSCPLNTLENLGL